MFVYPYFKQSIFSRRNAGVSLELGVEMEVKTWYYSLGKCKQLQTLHAWTSLDKRNCTQGGFWPYP